MTQIHAHLVTTGVFDSFWARKLLKFYLDFCHFDYTILIFRYIDLPGTFCINSVIKAYYLSLIPDQAVVFYFQSLKNGFFFNSHTFVPLIGSCSKMACIKSGEKCHGQAVKNGVDFVLQVQNSLIHMYGVCGNVEFARKVFDEMSIRDLVSWNSIVDVYARFDSLDIAHRMFDVIPKRNIASWNVMISGYLKGGMPGCVLKLFRQMMNLGFTGNSITMVNVLTACGRSARLKEGRSVHGFLVRNFLKPSVYLGTALIDMYSKCQKVEVALRVFENMSERNLICWNAMILGHSIHGNPEDGINLFDQARSKDGEEVVIPDEITFIGLLSACARARWLVKGETYFNEMMNMHSIKPNFAHYWCMANIYVSLGFMEQAEETIRNIPPDVVDFSLESLAWANLLSLCRFQGDVYWCEQIAASLIDMEPENLGYYRFLLNIYAVAGRWDDVAKVKEMIKKRRVDRMPGCNLVDLKEIVHELKSGRTLVERSVLVNVT